MEQRELGRSGVAVSAIGLGTAGMGLGTGYLDLKTPKGREAALEVLRAARSLGCSHVDTADGYGFGEVERLIGDLNSTRTGPFEPLTVTTKVGWNYYNAFVSGEVRTRLGAELGIQLDRDYPPYAILPFDLGQDFSREYLEFAVERSLSRLRMRCIDILLLHVPPLSVLRSPGWQEVLADFREKGKCRLYGVSVREPIEALAALENGKPDVIQVPIGIVANEPMRMVLKIARRRGIGIIGREILGGGRLVRQLSTSKKARLSVGSIVQCLIREVLDEGTVDAVVVGCRTVEQVRECLDIEGVDKLDAGLRRWVKEECESLGVSAGTPLAVAGPDPLRDAARWRHHRPHDR